jgi:hypothetical protein
MPEIIDYFTEYHDFAKTFMFSLKEILSQSNLNDQQLQNLSDIVTFIPEIETL